MSNPSFLMSGMYVTRSVPDLARNDICNCFLHSHVLYKFGLHPSIWLILALPLNTILPKLLRRRPAIFYRYTHSTIRAYGKKVVST